MSSRKREAEITLSVMQRESVQIMWICLLKGLQERQEEGCRDLLLKRMLIRIQEEEESRSRVRGGR
jgi:hypothetical protein